MSDQRRGPLGEALLIGRDSTGTPRVVDLSGLTIELIVPAPKAQGGTADLERRLAEARAGLEFYADGGEDKGNIARTALAGLLDVVEGHVSEANKLG